MRSEITKRSLAALLALWLALALFPATLFAENGITNNGTIGEINVDGGTMTLGGNGVYGDINVPSDATVIINGSFTISGTLRNEGTVSLAQNVTVTLNGALNNEGVVTNSGTILNKGTINNKGVINNNGTINNKGAIHDPNGGYTGAAPIGNPVRRKPISAKPRTSLRLWREPAGAFLHRGL